MRWQEPRAGVPLSTSSAASTAAPEVVLHPLGRPPLAGQPGDRVLPDVLLPVPQRRPPHPKVRRSRC
jgi:hypothetical protein